MNADTAAAVTADGPPLGRLPEAVLLLVLGCLDGPDLASVACTCRSLEELAGLAAASGGGADSTPSLQGSGAAQPHTPHHTAELCALPSGSVHGVPPQMLTNEDGGERACKAQSSRGTAGRAPVGGAAAHAALWVHADYVPMHDGHA